MSRIKIQENLHQYKMGKSKVGALNIVPIFTQDRKLTVWWNKSQKYKLTKNQKKDEKHFNSL